MTARLLFSSALMMVSFSAFAASDLSTSISAPASVYVDDYGTYTVTVSNIGNQTANSVSVVINLPETNTSPYVYVMGDLSSYSATCARSGSTLTCNLGTLKRTKSASVTFTIAYPYSSEPLVMTATAATTSSENTLANNTATRSASLTYDDVSFTAPRVALNQHCTGTGITSFFECELYPSSISSHSIELHADNTLTFIDAPPEYSGVWSQPAANQLTLTYYELGVVVAEFEGYGVSPSCWEGLTTFPGSTYVAPYQVCLQ